MNQTKEKSRLLALDRQYQPLYDELVRKGTSTIVTEDGQYIIRWEERNYAHLCGWDFFRDKKKTIPVNRNDFYKKLKRGFPLESYVKPSSASRFYDNGVQDVLKRVKDKAGVLPEALRLESATTVVQSAKSAVLIFFGNTRWALGLGWDEESNRYYPKSLLALDVHDKKVKRAGSIGRPIICIR